MEEWSCHQLSGDVYSSGAKVCEGGARLAGDCKPGGSIRQTTSNSPDDSEGRPHPGICSEFAQTHGPGNDPPSQTTPRPS